jgi:hypothetical protein
MPGADGAAGLKGETGATGATGTQGMAGPSGAPGPTGAAAPGGAFTIEAVLERAVNNSNGCYQPEVSAAYSGAYFYNTHNVADSGTYDSAGSLRFCAFSVDNILCCCAHALLLPALRRWDLLLPYKSKHFGAVRK